MTDQVLLNRAVTDKLLLDQSDFPAIKVLDKPSLETQGFCGRELQGLIM